MKITTRLRFKAPKGNTDLSYEDNSLNCITLSFKEDGDDRASFAINVSEVDELCRNLKEFRDHIVSLGEEHKDEQAKTELPHSTVDYAFAGFKHITASSTWGIIRSDTVLQVGDTVWREGVTGHNDVPWIVGTVNDFYAMGEFAPRHPNEVTITLRSQVDETKAHARETVHRKDLIGLCFSRASDTTQGVNTNGSD